MKPEIKAQWVAALRSGKYEQGHGRLREGERFCCLGVLCDVHDPDAWSKEVQSHAGLPPIHIEKWADFNSLVLVEIGGVKNTLYKHNDSGHTFAEIADAIEAQL